MQTAHLGTSESIAKLSSTKLSVTGSLAEGWVEVLVDCPGTEGPYVYLVGDDAIQPGDIVSVPLGPRQVGGIALALLAQLPEHLKSQRVRSVTSVLNRRFFGADYWALLERVAHHYQVPLMQVLRAAVPPGLLAASQRRIGLLAEPAALEPARLSQRARQLLGSLQQAAAQDYSWRHLRRQGWSRRDVQELVAAGWVRDYLALPKSPSPKRQLAVTVVNDHGENLSPRQREILAVLGRQGGELWLSDALQLCATTSATLRRLAAAGHVVIESRERLRGLESTVHRDAPKVLTSAQQRALDSILSQQGSGQILLHGVTGSGKTEIYLQAIAPLLATNRSALVLVPEIGLTPQLTDRFRQRFGPRVSIYHSALSAGERYDTWRQMLSGQSQVVIGTRSAVFAPLARLGLIILDEEHDSSFKQDTAPCYHARTVAQWRATQADCLLVLGSATPALESWVSAQAGRSLYLPLPQRIHARPLPPVEVVDMRAEMQAGNRSIFSRALRQGLEEMRSQHHQGLLFIHRRGHSSFVSCRSCGHVIMCPHCDVSLSYHQPRSGAMSLRCHYCGYRQDHPRRCPECASPYLKHFGSGTQRVEQGLKEVLPDFRCIRFDSDTTRRKGAHRALLSRFAAGEADLLVGTQMLTKGIDLPQVTLVGIIAADGLLYMNDYWAGERAFQTLTQVAGRAGRGDLPGRVILQTYTPEHPVVQAVQSHAYAPFAEREWLQRQETGYPPAGRLLLLRLSSPEAAVVERAATELGALLLQRSRADGTWELLGPVPAPIPRIARRFRWQLLLKGGPETAWPDLTFLRRRCPTGVSLTIDVDPLNFG